MSSELPSLPTGWHYVSLEACVHPKSITYGVVQPGAPVERGIPIVRVNNFRETRLDLSELMQISPEIEAKYARTRLAGGEVLLTLVGSVGQVAIAPREAFGFNVARAVGVIHPLPHIGAEWIGICLRSPLAQHLLGSKANTTVQTTINLKDVRTLPIPMPPVEERQRICDVLMALDARITLLRETNKTLESIAQAIFKSWFVDFDPVRAKMEGRQPEGMNEETAALFPDSFEDSELGSIPIGSQVMSIGDAVDTVGGATPDTKNPDFWDPPVHCWTTPKDLSGITAPILLDTERKLSPEGIKKVSSGLLPKGTLLLSSRAPIGYLALTQIPVAINQGYIAMLPGGVLPPLYLHFWCKQNMESIKGRANGSTFMEISKKAFRPIPILVPSPELIQRFANTANALFGRLSENERQAQTLSAIRETLLPRLISGQLRLPEDQEQIENALQ